MRILAREVDEDADVGRRLADAAQPRYRVVDRPWARGRRATSIPASCMAARVEGASDAGPIVATTRVRRFHRPGSDGSGPAWRRIGKTSGLTGAGATLGRGVWGWFGVGHPTSIADAAAQRQAPAGPTHRPAAISRRAAPRRGNGPARARVASRSRTPPGDEPLGQLVDSSQPETRRASCPRAPAGVSHGPGAVHRTCGTNTGTSVPRGPVQPGTQSITTAQDLAHKSRAAGPRPRRSPDGWACRGPRRLLGPATLTGAGEASAQRLAKLGPDHYKASRALSQVVQRQRHVWHPTAVHHYRPRRADLVKQAAEAGADGQMRLLGAERGCRRGMRAGG